MKQALITKYLEGETSGAEERELKRLLLDTPEDERSAEEQAILSLLTATDDFSDDEDIFLADHTAEFDRIVGHRRRLRLWTWAAAACVACLLTLCLVPRSYNEPHVLSQATVESPVVTKETLSPQLQPETTELPSKPRETKTILNAPAAKPLAELPAQQTEETAESAETTPETALQPEVTSADMAIVEQQVSRALIEKMVVDNLLNEIMIESHQQTSSKDEYTL